MYSECHTSDGNQRLSKRTFRSNDPKCSLTIFLCAVLFERLSELLEIRVRSPWLWPDVIYNLSSLGRELNECLKILHGFTGKV